jgi:putative ABC transport system permease protein
MTQRSFLGPFSLVSFGSDVRHACRQLWKAPLFTSMVILLLAFGYGVSIAIFSIVLHVLITPLPYSNPSQLVQIVSQWPKTGDQSDWTAPLRDALDWKSSAPAFQDVAVYRYNLLNLTGSGQPESLYGLRVTANLLPLLGVPPELGNWFSADYDRPGAAHVIVLSDDLWRRRFHADPGIVGQTIHLDDDGYEVVGVMPKSFNFPLRLGTTAQLSTDQMQYWMPLGADMSKERHGTPNAGVIARLKPGVSLSEAQAQLVAACRQLEREFPDTNRDLSARLLSLRQQTIHQVNGPLLALLAATALILLLTCVNIASLLLARGEARASELAIRLALGGGAWRVATLPLLQGVLLSCFGFVLSIPVALASLIFLLHLAPVNVPRLAAVSIDLTTCGFAMALALTCGLLVGGLNALQVLKRSPKEVFGEGSRTSAGRPRTRLRSALAVGQVALAVILICGAGLMLRTFVNLRSSDTGYRADHVFFGVTVLPPSRYSQFEQRQLFFKRVLDRLRNSPGVQSAAVSTGFPFVGQYDSVKAQSREMAENIHSTGVSIDYNAVSAGYLDSMGVRLDHGRLISQTDTAEAPKVAVIDENLAHELWPNQNPLGQVINLDNPASPVWRQVVGVLAPMRNKSLDVSPHPGAFVPLDQTTGYVNFVIVKTSATPEQASQLLKDTVAGVDANQGVFFVQSLPDLIADTIAVRRFLFILLAFFGGAALALSTLGIYALISFIAASRTREVGIRIALGATRGNIGRLVVSQGVRLALLGEAAGLIVSVFLTRLLSGLLYQVHAFDVETFVLTVAILAAATTIAALVPAWRSTRVQPMRALRIE